ncbi:hypothetical protein EV191_12262 [Tamaricihabitans halophyticus]|uniref:Excreted virulence factor EspC (Type VII ESX diderm) n=1 Tax=Tamaricihabitans halophyticus TaxID=1262583 RepID=A0A4R2Q6H0_9PSEU|nr:hypothetical protein [Tamaricihabitans halophyticus]TCP43448.1 hypothetical protein EV191_12262 [Tamaricihabitans halophyticus]
MSRQFDPDEIAALATKIGKLKESFNQTGTDLGDGNPGGAYGNLRNAASADSTTQAFYQGVNTQMGAAARLVDAAAKALEQAAERMRNDEDEGVRTFGGGNPERA